ncbi:MAG: ATP-binding cassette domain-containing protein [Deltaproteobacteria bacterium]
MLFSIKDLTKVYGNRTVLNLPDLVFEKGRIYALEGPNGSGKTTLLEILSLLMPPSTGIILYDDKKIDFANSDLTPIRREIVMVQQHPVLFTTTVYKNLEFGLKIRGISKMERQRIVEESLDLVGMQGFSHALAHKLSGGETQRVAIARALACSPRVQVPSTYENILAGKIVVDQTGRSRCLIGENLALSLKTEKKGSVKLTIDPSRITLLTPQEIREHENLFQGRLTELAEDQALVRGVVNIGIPIYVLLSGESLKDKGLTVGDAVTVLCPPEAIHVL